MFVYFKVRHTENLRSRYT